jgi:hypothetical protein
MERIKNESLFSRVCAPWFIQVTDLVVGLQGGGNGVGGCGF